MMKTNTTSKIVSEFFFLLALLILTSSSSSSSSSTNAVVVVEDQQRSDNNIVDNSKNPLVRFFSKQYENVIQLNTKSSSFTGGLLRRQLRLLLGDVNNDGTSSSSSSNTSNNKIKERFGPGADWTCTSKGAINFDSCVQNQEKGEDATTSSDATATATAAAAAAAACAWCPLGSTTGICLRTDQAELVNGLPKNDDHLLHLQCYNNNIEQEQLHTEIATSTSFWDETMACHAHTSHSCAGHHNGEDIGGKNHHICTWCTVKEPEIGMCISQNLWDNLVVAQALEEFDKDVSTNDQIRIDEVIHCVGAGDTDSDIDIEIDEKKSLFDTSTSTCGSKLLSSSASSLAKCVSAKDGVGGDGGGSEYCVIQANPFPGLMGYVAGEYCMSQQQQRFILWIIELLRGLGWEKEMSSYAK